MRLSPHLVFGGDCEAAFRFYEQQLGGTQLALFHDRDGKIVHASLTVGGVVVSGADVQAAPARQGFYLLLTVDTVHEAERRFATLAEGGTVQLALGKTFWSPAFGVVIDRFGVPWEISAAG